MINSSYAELTQKESIENACYTENKKKFLQINKTLAIKGQLAKELGFIRDSEAYTQILNRYYILLMDTDEYIKDYLKALQKPVSSRNTPRAVIPTSQF